MNLIFRTVLLLILSAALTQSARAADVDPLLPAETEQVVFVNVRQMVDSEFFKKVFLERYKKHVEEDCDASFLIFLKGIGIDPLKNVDSMSAGMWGKSDAPKGLVVVRGTFDTVKVLAAAEKAAAKDTSGRVSIVKEGGHNLVRHDTIESTYLAAAGDNTLLIGSDNKLVAAGMTAAANKAKPAVSKALAALIAGQDGNATIFWCDATAPLTFLKVLLKRLSTYDLGNPDALPDALHGVKAIKLGKELDFQVTYTMKDADGAHDLGATVVKLIDLVKSLLPLLQLFLKDGEWGDLIKEVNETLRYKVKGRDATVTLTLTLSADAVDKSKATLLLWLVFSALESRPVADVTVKPRKGEVVIIADTVKIYELYMGARPGSEVRTGLVKIGRVQEVSEPVTGRFVENRGEYTIFTPSGDKATGDPRVVKTAHVERSK